MLKAWADSVIAAHPSHVYVGADWYRNPDARQLAIGSEAESLLISLINASLQRSDLRIIDNDTKSMSARIALRMVASVNKRRAKARGSAGQER